MPDKYTIKNFSGYHSVEKSHKKLLEQVSDVIRLRHYSYKTEKSYISWIKRYILFDDKRYSQEMSSADIEAFLTHFAVEENVVLLKV